jgi:hypothetical protein
MGRALYLTVLLARRYLVALVLLFALAASALTVFTVGTGPAPQLPPPGAVLYSRTAELLWSRGTRGCALRLQVAIDDPGFAAPAVDVAAKGTGYSLKDLRAGRRYSWRLLCDGAPSAALSFTMSPDALGL